MLSISKAMGGGGVSLGGKQVVVLELQRMKVVRERR
jgi:hypothetical protein